MRGLHQESVAAHSNIAQSGRSADALRIYGIWKFVCTEIGMSWYNRVRLWFPMRSFWTTALLCLSLLPLTADDPVEKRADPRAPAISIQPRTRPSTNSSAETILDRRADLRIDTTLVLVPVAVTIAASGKLLTGLEKDNFEL